MKKGSMPIGISDFAKVIKGNYLFVDKSLIIKDILDERYEVTAFTRPRRFGKTITLSMIKYFFDCENAEANKKLFANLAIAKQDACYLAAQGKYPVIFLTFKDAKQRNWEECYGMLRQIIREEFNRFSQLLQSERLTEYEKKYMQSILDGKADKIDIEVSLARLTKILHSHYDKKPILLIDEYDMPIQAGYEHAYYDEIINFMRGFLSGGLKDNIHLNFAIMTGILRVAKESIFSGLNNVRLDTILSTQYETYFGFTTEELHQIAYEQGRPDKLSEIKEWYDGYKFGAAEIYNPWSVINYFSNDCRPDRYWLNTSSNDIIHLLLKNANPKIREQLELLLGGQSIISRVEEQMVYKNILNSPTTIFTFLAMTGYLKIVGEKSRLPEFPEYELGIPNREIRSVYRDEILDYLDDQIARQDLMELLMALLDGKQQILQERLQNVLMEMASSFDNNESFYHGFMLGISALLLGNYVVKSNRESGYGRFDIGIYPVDKSKSGVILEFKHTKNVESLEQIAQVAYEQIMQKNYMADFTTQDITKVYLYGIAFSGKRVKVYSK